MAQESIKLIINKQKINIQMINEDEIEQKFSFQVDQEYSYFKWKVREMAKKLKNNSKICKNQLKIIKYSK